MAVSTQRSEPIYHLVARDELRDCIAGDFYTPARFALDGFVHCAERAVVEAVADDYFGQADACPWLLEIDPDRLSAEVRYEAAAPIAGGGHAHLEQAASFPHVYGPIDLAAIVGVGSLLRVPEGYCWPPFFRPIAVHRAVFAAGPLSVRPVGLYDVEALHAIWNEPGVRLHLFDDQPVPLSAVEERVVESDSSFQARGFGIWGVAEGERDPLCGFVGLLSREREPPALLYGVTTRSWGAGIASMAAGAVMAYAFTTLRVERIVADVDAPNTASVRVLEKIGMQRTGERDVEGRLLLDYAIDRETWRGSAGG